MRTRIFLGLASLICAMILVIGCIFRSVHAGEGLPKETLGKEEQNLCEQLASETNETMLTEDETQSIPEEAITEITIDPVAEGAVEETEQIIIYLEETKEEALTEESKEELPSEDEEKVSDEVAGEAEESLTEEDSVDMDTASTSTITIAITTDGSVESIVGTMVSNRGFPLAGLYLILSA